MTKFAHLVIGALVALFCFSTGFGFFLVPAVIVFLAGTIYHGRRVERTSFALIGFCVTVELLGWLPVGIPSLLAATLVYAGDFLKPHMQLIAPPFHTAVLAIPLTPCYTILIGGTAYLGASLYLLPVTIVAACAVGLLAAYVWEEARG